MESYDKWPLYYEDSDLEIRMDPRGQEDFTLCIKKNEHFIYLPRGTLREIATSKREHGKRMLETLTERLVGYSLENTGLTSDSLIAAICKAYIKEEEDLHAWQMEHLHK